MRAREHESTRKQAHREKDEHKKGETMREGECLKKRVSKKPVQSCVSKGARKCMCKEEKVQERRGKRECEKERAHWKNMGGGRKSMHEKASMRS